MKASAFTYEYPRKRRLKSPLASSNIRCYNFKTRLSFHLIEVRLLALDFFFLLIQALAATQYDLVLETASHMNEFHLSRICLPRFPFVAVRVLGLELDFGVCLVLMCPPFC